MRISTQSFYDQSRTAMNLQQSNLLRVQQQIGAMTKILAPSDDPIGATRALGVSQSLALNAQYAASRTQATHTLSLEDNALQSVTTILQDIKGLVVQAGGTLTDADRGTIATTLQSRFDQLQGLANTDDGNGQFLFAGFKSGSMPFVKQADGSIEYTGDQGQRLMQVDVSRQMATTDDGRSIFQTVQGGAGYVNASGDAVAVINADTGVASTHTVVDPTDPNYGKDFVIKFLPDDKYEVTVPPETAVVASGTYDTPTGNQIQFGGIKINRFSTPNDNGTYSVSLAKNAGSGVFSANSVLDPTDTNYGKDFIISFPTADTYEVNTVPPGAEPLTKGAYTDGSPIKFGGVQINISGAPAASDSFTVSTAKNAGTNMFTAIGDVIAALKKPIDTGGSAERAQLLNALSTANKKITNAHDNVVTVRSSIGSRLQELDSLNVTGDSRTLFDKSHLSDLQDLDYATAISEFYQRQTALEATQQVFVKVQKISLLNYI